MLPLTWLLGLQATGCNWKRLNDCTDQVENAVFFDEVFSENESVVISNMGKPFCIWFETSIISGYNT